jgi:hypothetical protein
MKEFLSNSKRLILLGDIEETLNDKARWLPIISGSGGELQSVTLDIQQNSQTPECWDLVAILGVEEEFELSDYARNQIVDHLEEIYDSLYSKFEKVGLDVSMMSDYRVEIDPLN